MRIASHVVLTILMVLVGCRKGAVELVPACDLSLNPEIVPAQENGDWVNEVALEDKEIREVPEGPRPCLVPEKNDEANLDYEVVLRNYNEKQEIKVRDALERLIIVINSVEFKQRVLNHEYKGEKTFVDNNGLTNEEIYYTILRASEELNPGDDEVMNLDLTMYYKRFGKVVGYTYPDTMRIWVNSKYFNSYHPSEVATNMVHEWTHKLGFGHDFNRTARRPYSVPYGIGAIIGEMVNNM